MRVFVSTSHLVVQLVSLCPTALNSQALFAVRADRAVFELCTWRWHAGKSILVALPGRLLQIDNDQSRLALLFALLPQHTTWT